MTDVNYDVDENGAGIDQTKKVFLYCLVRRIKDMVTDINV